MNKGVFCAALSVCLTGSSPLFAAGDRWLGNLDPKNCRGQTIHRGATEHSWPFASDTGMLVCVWGIQQRLAYFVAMPDKGGAENKPGKPIMLADGFTLWVSYLTDKEEFQPYFDLESLYRDVYPFRVQAEKLCDQPAGSALPPSEL